MDSGAVESNSVDSLFTVMTYNIAHGRGTSFHQTLVSRPTMEENLQRIADRIRFYTPHVVALQELDQHSFWNHRLDQLDYLAELTGLNHRFHGIHQDRTILHEKLGLRYGVGLLSRLEPLSVFSHSFRMHRLDSKGFAWKGVQFAGKSYLVVGIHLDFQLHRRRLNQVARIIDHVRQIRSQYDHLILMGDFNCTLRSSSSALHVLIDGLNLHTFEPDMHRQHISFRKLGGRRLDYILVDQGLEFVEYYTGSAKLSDHEYVVARLRG